MIENDSKWIGQAELRTAFCALLLAALLSVLTGCETPAQRLDPGVSGSLKPGITTRAEVIQEFGEPKEIISEKGRTMLYYQRVFAATPNGLGPSNDTYVNALAVLLDEKDRVMQSRQSSHRVRTVFVGGLAALGIEIDDRALQNLKPHQTTRAEAIRLLGEPAVDSLMFNGAPNSEWWFFTADYLVGGKEHRVIRLIFDQADVLTAVQSFNRRNS